MAVGRSCAPDDELAQQRVVERRHLVAGVQVRVHPDPGPAGHDESLDGPGLGPEVGRRVLRVDAELDRVAPRDDVGLGERERLAGRDPDLGRDEVDAR